jgi:hypothetical protein
LNGGITFLLPQVSQFIRPDGCVILTLNACQMDFQLVLQLQVFISRPQSEFLTELLEELLDVRIGVERKQLPVTFGCL